MSSLLRAGVFFLQALFLSWNVAQIDMLTCSPLIRSRYPLRAWSLNDTSCNIPLVNQHLLFFVHFSANLRLHQSSQDVSKDGMRQEERSIANLVIIRGLPTASEQVQIQALEASIRAS